MQHEIEKEAKKRMQKSLHTLSEELAKQRAGRASPNLLDDISVLYYGNPTPLNQVASVVIENALMLLVKPWEKNMVQAIEKAIHKSDLGVNPVAAGDVIRVPLPALTEERRRELIKKVRTEGENTKVAVRNIRRDANQDIKDLLKDKAITEDDERKSQEAIQKMTDQFIKEIDKLLDTKEHDLMEI